MRSAPVWALVPRIGACHTRSRSERDRGCEMFRLKGVIGVVAVIAATLTLGSAPAAALAPTREPLVLAPVVIDGVCSFPVQAEAIVNREFITTFTDQDGNITKQIISGRLVTRLTNLDTGESVVVNTSGPGQILFEGDTVIFQGRGLGFLFFFPEQLGLGDPGLVIILKGTFTLTIAPDGTQTLSDVKGNVTDVCELLG